MKNPLEDLLARYKLTSTDDAWQALREIVQEIVLLGLWRGKFFEHAAFYGGTALRIMHGLPRYSEDLDFSLFMLNPKFSLNPYFTFIEEELRAFGFEISIVQKAFDSNSAIESAFVKMNTRMGFLTLGLPQVMIDRLSREQILKVKFEIDCDPPGDFKTETKYRYVPHFSTKRIFPCCHRAMMQVCYRLLCKAGQSLLHQNLLSFYLTKMMFSRSLLSIPMRRGKNSMWMHLTMCMINPAGNRG